MPRKTKEIAQPSPVAEQVTASVISERAEEELSKLDAQELEINRCIRVANEEIQSIEAAREVREARIGELIREVERLEADHAQELSYARLTGASQATVETKLLSAREDLAAAQTEHDQVTKAEMTREAELVFSLPGMQEESRALARQSEAIEAARDRAIAECGEVRSREAKQIILDCKAEVRSAGRVLKEKQRELANLLKSTEDEFTRYGWLDHWDTIVEDLEAQELAEEAAAIEGEDEDE